MSKAPTQGRARSADSTEIHFEHHGTGPLLVLIEAAGHSRELSSFAGLIPLLAAHCTVVEYDRRGRGASSDAGRYQVAREVEDVAAIVRHFEGVPGPVFGYGFSSGAQLALHAAGAGLPFDRLCLLEPPAELGADRSEQQGFVDELDALIAAGDPSGAVEYFLSGALPDEVLTGFRGSTDWAQMVAVAHTLPYDARVSLTLTRAVLDRVRLPTLVLSSSGSDPSLLAMVDDLTAALPQASSRRLPGQWHGVPDELLAEAILEFLFD